MEVNQQIAPPPANNSKYGQIGGTALGVAGAGVGIYKANAAAKPFKEAIQQVRGSVIPYLQNSEKQADQFIKSGTNAGAQNILDDLVELSRNPDAYTDLAQGAIKTLNEALPQTSKELAETVAAGVDTAQAALKEGITSKEAIKTVAINAANGATDILYEDIPKTFEAIQNTINAGRRTVKTALQEGDKETFIKTGRKILNEQGSELLERMPNSKESIKAAIEQATSIASENNKNLGKLGEFISPYFEKIKHSATEALESGKKASEIVTGACDKAAKTTNKYLKLAAGAALLLIPAGFGIGALIDKGIDKSKTAKENAQDSTQS